MDVLTTEEALRKRLTSEQRAGQRIGFVPTMGNLHDGHIALVEHAKTVADFIVVSIFVNPLQFNDAKDLDTYPRTLEEDQDKLITAGADVLFLPTPTMLYPNGLDAVTKVIVPELADLLEGEHRPGHFTGVTTVVAKLFNLVHPDVAVFGKKDYQQLQLIKAMVRDLNMPINIDGVDTQREATGLARSSRNNLLSVDDRAKSSALYACLKECASLLQSGAEPNSVERHGIAQLSEQGFDVDYVRVCRQTDLKPAEKTDKDWVILLAASIGGVRLIDNLEASAP